VQRQKNGAVRHRLRGGWASCGHLIGDFFIDGETGYGAKHVILDHPD
jgi:hypothetical protein